MAAHAVSAQICLAESAKDLSQKISINVFKQDEELQFYRLLEKEVDLSFSQIQSEIPDIEPSALSRIRMAMILKFRQLVDIKPILKSYGKTVGITVIAAGFASDIITLTLLALGKPFLAGLSVAAPISPLAGAAVVWWKYSVSDHNIAKELNLKSLKQLKQLRQELLGYDIKNRVGTILYETAQAEAKQALKIDVLTRINQYSQFKDGMFISFADLENIIRIDKKGASFLNMIYADQSRPSFYFIELLRFIQSKPELTEQCSHLLKERLKINTETDGAPITGNLRLFNDLQKKIDSEIKILLGRLTALKSRSFKIDREPRQKIKQQINGAIAQLNELQEMRKRAEYRELYTEYVRRTAAADQHISSEIKTSYPRLKDMLSSIQNTVSVSYCVRTLLLHLSQ